MTYPLKKEYQDTRLARAIREFAASNPKKGEAFAFKDDSSLWFTDGGLDDCDSIKVWRVESGEALSFVIASTKP